MQIKTITTVAGVNEIDFGNDDSQTTAHFYWFKNLSDSTLYVSAMPSPVAGEDNVAELSAKGAASVETDEGKVYVLGAGKVEIHRTNSKFCPFELPSTGSGGGGGSITVDSELSDTSTNPLQNKVTTAAINEINSALETKSDINHIHDISASGNPVVMDNLQGGVPFSEITIKGKNLIIYPYYTTTKTINGITFTDNGDGTITANGTATNKAIYFVRYREPFKLNPGNYVLSGCPAGGSKTTFYQWLGIWDGSTNIYGVYDVGDSVTATLTEEMLDKYIVIGCYIYAGATVDGITFCPQLEFGDTATAYEPPITGRELQVNVSGRNLIPRKSFTSIETNGITFILNNDGSITAKGTSTANIFFDFTGTFSIPDGIYCLSGTPSEYLNDNCYMSIRSNTPPIGEKTNFDELNGSMSVVSHDDAYCIIRINSGVDFGDGVTFYPQLEIGSTATPYEPYNGAEYTITPDCNPYVIPNDIRQQDGLNNISVSAGGLSVVGVQKNAAIKRIWDDMGDVKTVLATVTGGIE